MKKYFNVIDKQIKVSQGKNIFDEDNDIPLRFDKETINAISNLTGLDIDSENILIDYATDKALEEICRINQFYTFNSQARRDLQKIYRELFSSIKTQPDSIDLIEKKHYQNLKLWLSKTNPFAEKVYSKAGKDIEPVVCSEYSPDIQLNILKINTNTLLEPVLDIGCGKHGNLVKYLSKQGFNTKGIDRFSYSENNLINSDWLEFNYGTDKWGTVISNLGFSNHFKHHNLREDGSYIEYAKKYMEILNSLKIGGSFHYAPDLPFIECYLDKNQYLIEKYEIGQFDFKTTIIKRLR